MLVIDVNVIVQLLTNEALINNGAVDSFYSLKR